MSKLVEDKVAIVTGGSRGLGLAISQALAADGAQVLVVSRSEERGRSTVREIEQRGGIAGAFTGDITLPNTPAALVQEAVERFGRLDILVNCAGVFFWKKLLELTPQDWNETIATNLSAPFFLTQEAAKAMIAAGRGGSIINVTSIHGLLGDASVAAQCAAKFGLTGLTQASAEALREFDIRVNAVAPGSIEPDSGDRRSDSPKRKVTQADVATIVTFLASDLSRSITGATLDAFGSTRKVIKA